MRIDLTRITQPYHFRATNAHGHTVHMDSAPGTEAGAGISPMQLLIAAMGGCSGVDIALILGKQKQVIDSFDMELDAERPKGEPGAPYRTIHAHYILTGAIEPKKARRAVALSINKYCGVSRTLAPTATITASVAVNGERFDVDLD